MYYEFSESIYSEYGIETDPDLPDGVGFITGSLIDDSLIDDPLVFVCNLNDDNPPKHFHGGQIPVFSRRLIEVLKNAGIDNIQYFDARLVSENGRSEWDGYSAANVVGLLQCADMDKSVYTVIDPGSESLPPLVEFHTLVIDENRAGNMSMFRLVESPDLIIVHSRVIAHLSKSAPEGGWGATVEELESG